jgi:hypothetical protein
LVPSFLDNCLLPLFDPIQHSHSITSSARQHGEASGL